MKGAKTVPHFQGHVAFRTGKHVVLCLGDPHVSSKTSHPPISSNLVPVTIGQDGIVQDELFHGPDADLSCTRSEGSKVALGFTYQGLSLL